MAVEAVAEIIALVVGLIRPMPLVVIAVHMSEIVEIHRHGMQRSGPVLRMVVRRREGADLHEGGHEHEGEQASDQNNYRPSSKVEHECDTNAERRQAVELRYATS